MLYGDQGIETLLAATESQSSVVIIIDHGIETLSACNEVLYSCASTFYKPDLRTDTP